MYKRQVSYRLDKPEGVPEEMITEIPLNRQNEFMNMLMSMVDTKRSEGSINVDFKFEKITDMISPKKVMDDIRQNRKELQYTYGEYAKLDDGDPHKKDLADKLNVMFEEASANYNNVMAMLPLACLLYTSAILMICFLGAYSASTSMFSVYLVLVFGVIGVMMEFFKMPGTPLMLSFILGSKIESYFRMGCSYARGDMTSFVTRPISLILLLIAVYSVVGPLIGKIIKNRRAAAK